MKRLSFWFGVLLLLVAYDAAGARLYLDDGGSWALLQAVALGALHGADAPGRAVLKQYSFVTVKGQAVARQKILILK